MRIGIEAQRIFRKKKHGMDIYALELIRHLQQIDHENEYFIFVMSGEDLCLQETENFKIVEVPGISYADWEQIQLPRMAKKYNLDALHCTSNTAPLLSRIPLITTLHDVIYLDQQYQGGSWYQKLGHVYRKWVVPAVYKRAQKVFTVSDYERKRIAGLLGEESKLKVSYNGVSPMFKQVDPERIKTVKAQRNLPEEYLFFLGNRAPKKNMRTVLKAYSIYIKTTKQPLPLVVAESEESFLDQLLNELRIPEIKPFIHLTGYVKHAELPAIYSGATLFLYPSLVESFGIPIIEAMACGTPVVTSNTTSMPEISGEAAVLVNPTDASELAKAISDIVSSPIIKRYLKNQGLVQATKFQWVHTARLTQRVYKEVAGNTVTIQRPDIQLAI